MRPSLSKSRRGFTLVELLVVIAIIAILVSLLLPAVNSAREAARRVQCQNNIRNLALAVINYESSNRKLPRSSDAANRGSVSNVYAGSQMSWMVRVLPYFEEQAIYDQIDFTEDIFHQDLSFSNGEPWFASEISIGQCPSDAAFGRVYRSDSFTPGIDVGTGFAKGNYAAYVGPEHVTCQRVFTGALIFEDQSLRKIKDGVSKTIVLSEVRTRAQEDDQRGAWALAWAGASLLSLDVHSQTTGGSTCAPDTPVSIGYIPDPDFYLKAQPPNNPVGAWNRDQIRECNNASEADLLGMPCSREAWSSAAPRSLHNGGVNTAQLDGSVRFIVDDIDVGTFATLICINDGLVQFESID